MAQRPISWFVLPTGSRVLAKDGTEVGKVSRVIGDRERDIFAGIAYKPGLLESEVFAPADAIDHLAQDTVRLSLSHQEAERLGHYEG